MRCIVAGRYAIDKLRSGCCCCCCCCCGYEGWESTALCFSFSSYRCRSATFKQNPRRYSEITQWTHRKRRTKLFAQLDSHNVLTHSEISCVKLDTFLRRYVKSLTTSDWKFNHTLLKLQETSSFFFPNFLVPKSEATSVYIQIRVVTENLCNKIFTWSEIEA